MDQNNDQRKRLPAGELLALPCVQQVTAALDTGRQKMPDPESNLNQRGHFPHEETAFLSDKIM
jgi:hypothetical protein